MKVACPRCGEPGYMTRVKVHDNYYMRIEHWTNGRKRVCYLGRDVREIRDVLSEIIGGGSNKIIRFPGGDFYIADLLLPRLERLCPKPKCTFVEVFGGSGYMSQVVPRDVFDNIIYNDINNMLTALYRYVKESPERLAAVLVLLPYSRSVYKIVRELLGECRGAASLVVAAMAFYAYNASFSGTYDKRGFASSIGPARNEAKTFRTRTASILKLAAQWKDVVIENLDFRNVIKKYDAERAVFYLDPPYVDRAEEYYGTPFTVDDLREMATMLTQIRGKFLLKLDYKTYEPIKDILSDDKYNVEIMERPKHMQKVRGGQRDKWLLTLVGTKL
ncbi:MAG: DNA adenine methylase [Pyrobaculum sp.]